MRRILLALLLARRGVAEARSEKTLAYQRDPAWPAAVRFLRVDAQLKLIEKDADAGYVIFELNEEKQDVPRLARGDRDREGRPQAACAS